MKANEKKKKPIIKNPVTILMGASTNIHLNANKGSTDMTEYICLILLDLGP